MRPIKYEFAHIRKTDRKLYDKLWYQENKKLSYNRLKKYRDKNRLVFLMYNNLLRYCKNDILQNNK